MEHVNCCLCGSDSPRPYKDLTDRFSGQQFQLAMCTQCGLVYSAWRPSMAELPLYYPHDYEAYQQPMEEMTSAHAWHVNRMWEMQVDYVERFKPSRGRLLDIGCATGEFLFTAKKRGWQVQGLEMIKQTAQIARQRFNLDVTIGTIETAELPDNSFDAITLWDVLEHLPDPVDALHRCQRLLKRDGIILMSIPNLASFDRYLLGRSWIGWDAPRHFTLFTTGTLKEAFAKAGFAMLDNRCFLGGKGTFLLSLDTLLGTRRGTQTVKKYYPLISALLWPYRQVSYIFHRGPILAVAARKLEEA